MNDRTLSRFLSPTLALFTLAGAAATQGPPGTIKVLGPGGGTFATIQAAVNAAAPGATVLVLGGTHAENVQISKPLTLRGAANATISVAAGSAIFVDRPAGRVRIENLTLESLSTTAPTVEYLGLDADPANLGTITGSDIRGGFIGAVIQDCNARVTDNHFGGNKQRGLQINSGVSAPVTAVVSHNTFTGQFVVGAALQPTSANGLSVFNCSATVADNTFDNLAFGFAFFACAGAAEANVLTNVGLGINVVASPGFSVLGNTCTHEPGFSAVLETAGRVSGHVRLFGSTGVLVSGNTLSGATIDLAVLGDSFAATITDNIIRDAIRVGGNSGTGISFDSDSAQGASIHGNNIEGNATFAVHDFGGSSFTIDATDNWWGSAGGPLSSGPNRIVAPNVVFSPFLAAPNLNAGA